MNVSGVDDGVGKVSSVGVLEAVASVVATVVDDPAVEAGLSAVDADVETDVAIDVDVADCRDEDEEHAAPTRDVVMMINVRTMRFAGKRCIAQLLTRIAETVTLPGYAP